MANYVAVLLLGIASKINGHEVMSGEHLDHRGCGTEHYMEDMLANDPEWKAKLDQFEIDFALRQNKIKSGELSPVVNSVTIPVVYHILYNTNAQNVPDSTIAYQNNRLQADFSATNTDYGSTPPAFTSPVDLRSGDFGFTVVNDQVIRKATSVSSFGTNNNIKFDSSGGSSVVSPASKLNFWSGALSGGLLGYAQFPGGNPSTDGVVQLWSSLSPEVGGNSPYNLGRTGTHEIGHWLNLRHIWGDSNSCTINDGVNDTPAQSGPNFGCPSPNNARLSCPSQNPYPYDMYCNYMDYVNDACMVMFSRGQYDRAWASIFQFRQGFNPSSIITADVEYINWLYFIEFDHEIENNEDKCYSGYKLFYDNNLNENSNSNKYIYGCTQSTKSTNVRHISDIQFIYGKDSECPQGWEQASQNLNAGNDENNPIYMCYLRQESNIDNNEAVLDMTFIRNGDSARFTSDWTIYESDNINPNGVSLHLAVKKGKYLNEKTNLLQNEIEPDNVNEGSLMGNNTSNSSIIIASLCGLIAVLVIAFVVWKFVCAKAGFKDAMKANSESLVYGATELSQIEPEIK